MNSLTDQPVRRNSDLQRRIVRTFSVALTSLFLCQSAIAATSVSKNGITWIFSSDRPVGQYCNGDWWVVGPVTITSISPASGVRVETLANGNPVNRVINGTMVNPVISPSYRQAGDPGVANGFDNAVTVNDALVKFAQYDDTFNVAPSRTGQALVCSPGTSVVSSISTGNLPLSTSHPRVSRIAILTVVDVAPPSDSFRPPPIGTDKTHRWTKGQLNYGILKNLQPVASTPTLASVEAEFTAPWTIFHTGNATQSMSPSSQMPNYGRDQAHAISRALLSLHLNYTNAQKEKLYIVLVQYGIDIYGFMQNGGFTRASAGLNGGRKASLVLAATALNDPLLKEWAGTTKTTSYPVNNRTIYLFHEDSQMFVVTNADVGRFVTQSGGYRETYGQQHVGLPEWGGQHMQATDFDGSNWGVPYRPITNSAHVGNALGIKLLTGGEAVWGNPIFFDYYYDRVWSIEGAGSWDEQGGQANKIPPFDFDMMKAYKDLPKDLPAPSSAPQSVSWDWNRIDPPRKHWNP